MSSSAELSEWEAYFTLLDEGKPDGSAPMQQASNDAAYELLAKAAKRGGH